MDYCGPKGLPLSEFLQWDPEDQENALEHAAHEARRYPDGTHPEDWNESSGGSRRAFHTHIDIHPGAQIIEAALASEDYSTAGRGAHVHLVAGDAASCPRCLRTADANSEED